MYFLSLGRLSSADMDIQSESLVLTMLNISKAGKWHSSAAAGMAISVRGQSLRISFCKWANLEKRKNEMRIQFE